MIINALARKNYKTTSSVIQDEFDSLSVDGKETDIVLRLSKDETSTVICKEKEGVFNTVSIEEGELKIEQQDNRKWMQKISMSFESARIEICLPKKQYAALRICTGAGNITIADALSFQTIALESDVGNIVCNADSEQLNVETHTGKIVIADWHGENAMFQSVTGNIKLKNLVSKTLQLENHTGNVTVDRCDAQEISIQTTTGNVQGDFLSDKIFHVETETGNVEVPQTVSGGECTIKTSTGNVRIKQQ